MSPALSAVSCLRDSPAPAFFHTSRGTDNSLSADLGSPCTTNLSVSAFENVWVEKKLSFGAQKRVPAKTRAEEYSQETSQVEAGELSSGVVLAVMELSQ